MTRLEELAVHRRRDQRAGLHAEVVTEHDDVDVLADGSEENLEVRQVLLHDAIEKRVRPARIGGEKHQEVVVAVEKTAGLEQVAAEQADDRALGALPQRPRAGFQTLRSARAGGQRAGR